MKTIEIDVLPVDPQVIAAMKQALASVPPSVFKMLESTELQGLMEHAARASERIRPLAEARRRQQECEKRASALVARPDFSKIKFANPLRDLVEELKMQREARDCQDFEPADGSFEVSRERIGFRPPRQP